MDEKLFLQFLASLTLCDHMGDVANDIEQVLGIAGIDLGEWGDLNELHDRLAERGITTLYDTTLNVD